MGACVVHLLMRFFWSSLWSGEPRIKASVVSHKMANWISPLLKHRVVPFLLLVCKLSFMFFFFFSGERLIYFGLIWHVLMYHCSLECHWNPGLPSDFVLSSITIWGFCLPPSFLCPLGLCPNINYCCHIRRSCTKYVQNACGANYKDSYCFFFAVLILTIKDSTYALP